MDIYIIWIKYVSWVLFLFSTSVHLALFYFFLKKGLFLYI